MSPSRGLRLLSYLPRTPIYTRRLLSTLRTLSASPTPLQIYLSTTHSASTNLSLEHYLLSTSAPTTTLLLLYTNTPTIVLGRNQNPWLEANLPLLSQLDHDTPTATLLRRRSGGGTVFHDTGNINYSVIMPTSVFDRDRHAVMVVRALRRLGVREAVVNKRHDIVVLPLGKEVEETKMEAETPEGTRKVSGSAYKLTRMRSYHHGTMLLETELASVGRYLRSYAGAWMSGRGVGSVRSPVANVGIERERFVNAVVDEMAAEYLGVASRDLLKKAMEEKVLGDDVGICYVSEEEALEVPEIRKGAEELKSLKWTYAQTPQLTFSVPPPEGAAAMLDGVPQPPEGLKFSITANKGVIGAVNTELGCMQGLLGLKFDGGVINDHISKSGDAADGLGEWIERVLGRTEWGTSDE